MSSPKGLKMDVLAEPEPPTALGPGLTTGLASERMMAVNFVLEQPGAGFLLRAEQVDAGAILAPKLQIGALNYK